MASLQCGTPCGRALHQRSAFKSRSSRPTSLVVRSQKSSAQAVKQVRDAAASLAASLSAAALLLATPANAAAPTLFDSNTSYSQELQDLVDKRGGLSNFTPPEPAKKAANKASDAADNAKFKLDNVTKGLVTTPESLEQALPDAAQNLPSPSLPSADSLSPPSAPSIPKFEAPKLEAPKLEAPSLPSPPKIEAPSLDVPSLPSPPKVEAPKLAAPSVPTPSAPELPQQPGGGLPTPYLAAGGAAALAIVGIGLAGAKPDSAKPAAPAVGGASSKGGSSSSSGSGSSVPEGKDPELDSEVARKKDPFFKEVDKRTK